MLVISIISWNEFEIIFIISEIVEVYFNCWGFFSLFIYMSIYFPRIEFVGIL